MATRSNYNTISDLATAVFDNGRRGSPKPGCDCVQCFGYCIVDQAIAEREGFARRDNAKHVSEDIQ